MKPNSGYFGLWRKLFFSEVWRMTPVYSRVWLWIIGNVQWQLYEAKTATNYCIYVLPGQKITSLNDIAHGASWEEWGKEKIPNRKTISTVLEWMKNRGQINIESNNKHTFITVVNWDTYQDLSGDKVTEKVTHNGQQMDRATDTNKKEKKEKKEKPTSDLPIGFDDFWTAYPRKVAKSEALTAWKKINPQNGTRETIIKSVRDHSLSESWTRDDGKFIPYPATFLNKERWKDEVSTINSELRYHYAR